MSLADDCGKRILGSRISKCKDPEDEGTWKVYVLKKSERSLRLSGVSKGQSLRRGG